MRSDPLFPGLLMRLMSVKIEEISGRETSRLENTNEGGGLRSLLLLYLWINLFIQTDSNEWWWHMTISVIISRFEAPHATDSVMVCKKDNFSRILASHLSIVIKLFSFTDSICFHSEEMLRTQRPTIIHDIFMDIKYHTWHWDKHYCLVLNL